MFSDGATDDVGFFGGGVKAARRADFLCRFACRCF